MLGIDDLCIEIGFNVLRFISQTASKSQDKANIIVECVRLQHAFNMGLIADFRVINGLKISFNQIRIHLTANTIL